MYCENSIFIIIPVHNRKSISLACLENLKNFGKLDSHRIVVIDDGSTDGTEEKIRSLYPQVEILNGDGNLWWTGAISWGMEYAYTQGAEYIIWLNDDCELLPETLPALLQVCQENSEAITGVQGFLKEVDNQLSFGGKRKTWKGYRLIHADKQILPCDLLSGNIVCLPRHVIDVIGYPDTTITPHYGGDSLYLLRAQQAGFQLFVDARYPALDLPGESTLYPPSNWLTCPGEPHRLLKLVFNPYSGLSWKLWLTFNWEAYGLWGIIMFLKKYLSILFITGLRYTPLFLRKRIETAFGDI